MPLYFVSHLVASTQKYPRYFLSEAALKILKYTISPTVWWLLKTEICFAYTFFTKANARLLSPVEGGCLSVRTLVNPFSSLASLSLNKAFLGDFRLRYLKVTSRSMIKTK